MTYTVGTSSNKVYKSLVQLEEELPVLFKEMKSHLSEKPHQRMQGKYFVMQQHYANDYSIIILLN